MTDIFGRLASIVTNKIFSLPVVVLMPHSSCNCRCVMCDIWKANQTKEEISVEELEKHLPAFRKLGVRRVALSGGEALLHSNLWKFCELLHSIGIKISLLSTGITLKSHAANVVKYCDDVIVSLDGSPAVHSRIRNLPRAFEKLEEGVKSLKAIDRDFRVTARTVLQRQNFRDLPGIIRTAKELGLDQISFLAADVSTGAFNRSEPWSGGKVSEIALTENEANELENVLRKLFNDFRAEFDQKFIAESREKLLSLVQYYRAINNNSEFPSRRCNAPWVSAVIESTGEILPCFFHKSYGNIKTEHLTRSLIPLKR